ncbi:MAG TPA: Ku protein [Rhizobiaceae bacterium]|nr:Ku protein [Rhizobiaceae bacterium]
MRSIWSGAISFGLIYIPIKLFSANEEQQIDFDMLRKGDLCPIRYVRVCESDGEEVEYKDIVKGYQFRKGDYVVVTDDDFKRAAPKKTQTIEIVAFIKESEVDAKLLEKPYFIEPVKGAARAYALLREALRKTEKVAVAKYVLRTRERMCLLRPEGDMIVLLQMRWASQVRDPEGLELPPAKDVQKKELDMAVRLVDQMTETFDPTEYQDTYTETLLKFIEDKAAGKAREPEEEEAIPSEVTDLFAKLRESLEMAEARK